MRIAVGKEAETNVVSARRLKPLIHKTIEQIESLQSRLQVVPLSAQSWDGTLQGREYLFLIVSFVTLFWLIPLLNFGILLGTALVTYGIGESPRKRGQKLGILIVVLGVFVSLRSYFPRPAIPYVLWGRQALEAFFILRCVDFALNQRLDTKNLGPLDRFGRFFLWIFFLPTVFAGPVASYRDFYSSYHPKIVNWGQLVFPNMVKIAWGGIKFTILTSIVWRLSHKLWSVATAPNTDLFFLGSLDSRLLVGSTLGLELILFYLMFSGFTDMAIGFSRLLGFHLYENFDHPLFSTNPLRYWKTSNISTYRWLMTHIFLPYWDHSQVTAKVITTFLVSALWHCTVVPLGHWEAVFQVMLAFLIFSVIIAMSMKFSQTTRGMHKAWMEHRSWLLQSLVWLGKVAITFCFIALIHKLFWNGLTGRPLAATLQVYQQLFFGVR